MKKSTRIDPLAVCLSILLFVFVSPVFVASGNSHSSSSLRPNHRLLQFDAEQGQPIQSTSMTSSSSTSSTATTIQTTSTPAFPPLDDASLREAVHEWVTNSDKTEAIAKYGPISQWNTSKVTTMSHLFTNARFFNEDLSKWDTSRVSSMTYMFAFCSSFSGGDLSNWETGKVTDMSFMFHHATMFEGKGLGNWDVRHVQDLTYFAQGATSFNANLWRWEVDHVRSFNRAFHNATSFDQQLCWNIHPHASVVQTFCGANGASFTCDPHKALQSSVNQEFHDCCDCPYNANQHYYGKHRDDDSYWGDAGDNNSNVNHKMGVILASVIWAMVFVMIVLVTTVTMRRRHEVRQWLEDKLQTTSSNSHRQTREQPMAPDGNAIATFVGSAETASSTSSTLPQHIPDDQHQDIPMVLAGITKTPPVTHAEAAPVWVPDINNNMALDLTHTTGAIDGPPVVRTTLEAEEYET